MSTYYYYSDTLYHHGIKGQKWGLRRYQNEDGSLTSEGRRHYGYGEVKAAYKKRLSDADSSWKSKSDNLEKEYFRRLEDIEKNYKRGQMLSEKDQKRESELDEWWDKEQKKLNADRDLEKKNAKIDFKNSDEYKARQEKIKKAAKIGLAVAGTALAAYGAYKVSEAIKNKKFNAAKEYGANYYASLFEKNDTKSFLAGKDADRNMNYMLDVNSRIHEMKTSERGYSNASYSKTSGLKSLHDQYFKDAVDSSNRARSYRKAAEGAKAKYYQYKKRK